jgi:hypothetical protein
MVLTKDRDRERGVSSLEAESYNYAIYSRSEDQLYSNDDEPWENICFLCLGLTVPMGTDPVGRLIYDARGGMFIEIMRKERPRSRAAIPPQVTPEEAKSAFDGYIAYFGTYTLDETAHTVTHRVEASLFPNWVGTEQKRTYSITDEGLRLTDNVKLPDGTGLAVETLWKRLY